MRIIIVHARNAFGAGRNTGRSLGRQIGQSIARHFGLATMLRRTACLAISISATLSAGLVLAAPPAAGGPMMTPTQLSYERERLEGLARKTAPLRVLDISYGFQAASTPGPVATVMPIAFGLITSTFGMRTDPITRSQALHEGQDFAAPSGTPILAAASGIVIDARTHPEYGQMIDIDHGNDLVTRYAHASLLLVSRGDLVRRGQQIALVGSTGRSTGPHLHFEVRRVGVAVDPVRFLGDQARPATVASGLGRR